MYALRKEEGAGYGKRMHYITLCWELILEEATDESVAYPEILFGGGVQQVQLRTEDRESGDLGAVAP